MAWTITAPPAAAADRGCIFINYRRDDSGGHVLALMPMLSSRFGGERIFKDTDSIPAGHDFVKAVQRSLDSCRVMLVVIGPDWLSVEDPRHKRRRLDDPDDMVRLEIATALKSEHVIVIPVLVGRATMPAAEDLPTDLKPLARRNNVELRDTSWNGDSERLIRLIESTVGRPSHGILNAITSRSGILSVGAILVVVAFLGLWKSGTLAPQTQPQPATPVIGQTGPSRGDIALISPDQPTTQATASTSTTDPGNAPTGRESGSPPTATAASKGKPARQERTGISGGSKVTTPRTTAANGTRIGSVPIDGGQTTPAPSPPEEDPRPAIRTAIESFRTAFNHKDEAAMRAIFPSAPAGMFGKSKNCVEFTVDFATPKITMLSSTSAQVDVGATYYCKPDTKNKAKPSDLVTDVFVVARTGSSWQIKSRLAAVE